MERYYYNPNLPKRVTARAIMLTELQVGKDVYTNDADLYKEMLESHPEFSELIHFVEPQHMRFSPGVSGISWRTN